MSERGKAAAAGRDLGPYRVLKPIARGTSGGVFLAQERATGKKVALKLVFPEVIARPEMRERIRQAMLLTERIRHPGICRLEGLRREQGVHYIAMEYCEGMSLRDLLASRGALPVDQVVAIARSTCAALAAAHAAGIVHRDLRPGHIVVAPDDTVKIIDFGMASALDLTPATSSAFWGTRTFAAPELQGGEVVSPKSDQFALGVVLYAALTGHLPFPQDPAARADIMRRRATLPTRSLRAEIPPALDAIVMRAIDADPGKRFASVADLDAALEAFAANHDNTIPVPHGHPFGAPVPAPRPSPPIGSAPTTTPPAAPKPITMAVPMPSSPFGAAVPSSSPSSPFGAPVPSSSPSSPFGVPVSSPSSPFGMPVPSPSSPFGMPVPSPSPSAPRSPQSIPPPSVSRSPFPSATQGSLAPPPAPRTDSGAVDLAALDLPSADVGDEASWVVNGAAVGPPVQAKAMDVPDRLPSLSAELEPDDMLPLWEEQRASGRTFIAVAVVVVLLVGAVAAYFHFFR